VAVDNSARLELLYLANATALICHEIDSAFWHEWQLFHLPGGIQLFLLLHLLLLPVVLYGYREVCARGPRARMASMILASVGIFAALLHGAFIAAGDAGFSLPLSQALLVMTLLLSIGQWGVALRMSPGVR
jgi:hypothetical protein